MPELTITAVLVLQLLLSRVSRSRLVSVLLGWRRQLYVENLDTVASHLHRKVVLVEKERGKVAEERDLIRADMEELATASQIAMRQLEARLATASVPPQQLQDKKRELCELQEELISCSKQLRPALKLKVCGASWVLRVSCMGR